MVPPQTGQFQSGTEWVWVEVCAASICRGSPALWNRWKQSGRSVARRRLARKPKLRMRTKPRGSRWRRNRRRNKNGVNITLGDVAHVVEGDGETLRGDL